jgi:hypothetical protein
MIVRRNYQQILRQVYSASYNFSKIVALPSPLTSSAQAALIAYFAISYIKEFDPSSYLTGTFSIRDNLLSRTVFNSFICKMIDDHLMKTDVSLNQPT